MKPDQGYRDKYLNTSQGIDNVQEYHEKQNYNIGDKTGHVANS